MLVRDGLAFPFLSVKNGEIEGLMRLFELVHYDDKGTMKESM